MSMTQINWYPGHMKKTKDLIEENLKLTKRWETCMKQK